MLKNQLHVKLAAGMTKMLCITNKGRIYFLRLHTKYTSRVVVHRALVYKLQEPTFVYEYFAITEANGCRNKALRGKCTPHKASFIFFTLSV